MSKKSRVTDVDNAAVQRERRWGHAIREWQEGRPEGLCDEIRALRSIPNYARDFLIDLSVGKASRRKGAPPTRTPEEEREIAGEVYSEQDAGAPNLEEARAIVARKRDITEDQVRHVVDKLREQGLGDWMFKMIKKLTKARERR